MTELKTLKDIERLEYHSCLVNDETLKQEAIKWCKKLSKPKGYIEFGSHSFSWDDTDKINWYTLAYRGIVKWAIMHLNNITEEDLK